MSQAHVALVTGASSGIGAAIAAQLVGAGAFVLVGGRDPERTAAVAQALEDAEGGRAVPVEFDLSDAEAVRRGMEAVRVATEGVGPVDWLINNAGLARSAPLLPKDGDVEALFAEHMQVNFHGARRVIEAVLPGMLEREYGRIVNVASSAGLYGYPYVSAYCASKHALVGYSQSAALELARTGIAINLVCPHYVDTPMTDRSIEVIVEKTGKTQEEARAFFAAQNPGGRLVEPEEVAGETLALLEGERTGVIVELDGSTA